ncbi:MAG: LLM class flavin-dependent oxidoreductase [Acidimicrobiales bacterium]
MITSTIRFNFALPGQDPAENTRRHQAAVAMAEAADRAGLTSISLEEHHGVRFDDQLLGWCASPITLAAAMLARTQTVTVALWGLALPLHDPIRIAEDVATLDLLAPGRVVLIVNTGYREIEFVAHGRDFAQRAETFDTNLELLRAAWTQEHIDRSDTLVSVTPRPVTRPHPTLMVSGATVADAERAAAHGLAFRPSADEPQLRQAYEQGCEAAGHSPLYLAPPATVRIVQVADDPDEWWAAVGPNLLREAQIYASWMNPGEHSAVHSRATTVDELRAEGRYRVLTPPQCVQEARRDQSVLLHPLCGGTPLDRAERTVELFVDEVLPHLDA